MTKSSLLTYERLRSFGRCTADILLDWKNQSTRQILSNLQISCFASKSARSALASNHVGFETMQQARHARQSSRRRTIQKVTTGRGHVCYNESRMMLSCAVKRTLFRKPRPRSVLCLNLTLIVWTYVDVGFGLTYSWPGARHCPALLWCKYTNTNKHHM